MCISNGNNSGNGIGSLAARYSKISTDAGKAGELHTGFCKCLPLQNLFYRSL